MGQSVLRAWGGVLLCGALGIGAGPACRAQDQAPVGNPLDGASLPGLSLPRTGARVLSRDERNEQAVAPLALAAGGRSLLPIIIARKASPETRRTAAELATFLERISGAPFPVQTPDGAAAVLQIKPPKTQPAAEQARAAEEARAAAPPEVLPLRGIVLGTLDEWAAADLAKPLAIRDDFDGREAFAIRTQPDRLLLIAATDRGVGHVAFRFLEALGCRWFFPNSHWEIVPSQPGLSFGMDITDRPSIASRSIFFSDGGFSDEGVGRAQSREPRDLLNWQRHNRLGGSLRVSAGHMWHNVVKENMAILREHPEYFAEVGGKRTGFVIGADGKPALDPGGNPTIDIYAKLELANPAVRKMFVDYALAGFRARTELDMMSLDPSDGGGHSESEAARKLGTVSDAVFGMANEVARAVQSEFPGKMVGLLAYNYHIAPPAFALEPNVYVELTAGFNMSRYSYAELFDMWPRKARHIGFYEYFSVYDWDQDKLPGGRIASIRWLRERIPYYAALNAASISAQSGNSWGPHGRGYYLASRLLWNPQADADAILADFYDRAYGPAAASMTRFHERICPDSSNLVSTVLVGQAFRDVDEATRAARDRPDVLARLSDIKQYLRYLHLRWMLDDETDKSKKRDLFVRMMRQLYGSRYSYMTHWAAAAYRLGKIYGVQLNDITLVPSGGRGHPKFGALAGDRGAPDVWTGAPEPTPEQIEAEFQEGLAYFPAFEVREQSFDLHDLVPVQFPPSKALPPRAAPVGVPPGMRTDYYQSGPRYVFHSFAGEPINLEITTGKLAQYRGRGDATWWLRRPDGSVVATGRMPLDDQARHLELKVPTNGTYLLEFKSNGSGWTITYPTNQPASVVWSRGGQAGFGAPVFYVPKGTTQIQYYWDGGAHEVFGPDGRTAGKASGNGIIATVAVPRGMDGRVWGMRTALRGAWFMNLPNVVAATPEALMVPRDVAEKDGLEIRRR